jgi:DNA-binding transcriptional ArsR family regulator
MGYESVLDALGDPTRRRILDALRAGPLPVGAVAAGLPVSRPAVSKHLRVLEGAGLVTYEASGTRRLYRIDEPGLAALRAWIDGFWGDILGGFAAYVEQQEGDD